MTNYPIDFKVVGVGDVFWHMFYPAFLNYENNGSAKLSAIADVMDEDTFNKRIYSITKSATEKTEVIKAAQTLADKLKRNEVRYFQSEDHTAPKDFWITGHGMDNRAALYVATPNDEHRAYAIQGLEHEYHLLVEKPLASSIYDTWLMEHESWLHPRLVCMETEHYVHKPTVLKLLTIVDSVIRECGPIISVTGKIREAEHADTYVDSGNLKIKNRLTEHILRWERGGGITRDTGIHLIAIMKVLGAQMVVDNAKLYNLDENYFTADTAMIGSISPHGARFKYGSEINLEVAKFCDEERKYLDISFGKGNSIRGHINIDFSGNTLKYEHNGKIDAYPKSDDMMFKKSPHENLLGRFIDAVNAPSRDNTVILTPFSDATNKIMVIEDIYKKSREKNYGALWQKNAFEFYSHGPPNWSP